jgi:hypothetical protein
VIWGLLVTGVVGFLTGFRLRAPALAVMSMAVISVNVIASILNGWTVTFTLLFTFGLVFELQVAYFFGTLAASGMGDGRRGNR